MLGRQNGSDQIFAFGKINVYNEMYVEDSFTTNGNLTVGGGEITVPLSSGGSDPVCSITVFSRQVFRRCSSSIRFKTNVQNFTRGLDLINLLRPVTYDWKENGFYDIGFIAEEVAAIDPVLATYDQKGQIEGVKYAQITTALVNAVKEQQEQIKQLQAQIEALKSVVCAAGSDTVGCQTNRKQSNK